MKRTSKDRVQRTLTLPEELDEQLRAEAGRLRIPMSYLAEKAIAAYLLSENINQQNLVA